MRLYNSDLSALLVYAVVVILQMFWLVFVEQANGN